MNTDKERDEKPEAVASKDIETTPTACPDFKEVSPQLRKLLTDITRRHTQFLG